jgi:acyl-CoA reductase-like NAD-dependent aldehyde dehydrogenase
MREYLKSYIDGGWTDPAELKTLDVDNPAIEEVYGKIARGSGADVDRACRRRSSRPWGRPLEHGDRDAEGLPYRRAAGCDVGCKGTDRRMRPHRAMELAEIMHAARLPAGVFNLVQGDGPGVGVALARHPDVDMNSFTGSTRTGVEVARNAASTIKRVCQELGGKGPNIILDDSTFAKNVASGVGSMMGNSGQTCGAPSRMLIPKSRSPAALADRKD